MKNKLAGFTVFLVVVLALFSCKKKPLDPVLQGGLIWNNWTKVSAGGTGKLPEGVLKKDFIRCKACHGWDALGKDGGYVRRTGFPEVAKRPRPSKGTNLTSKIGKVTVKMVAHEKGRALSEMNNDMVNFSAKDGLTLKQLKAVAAFLNNGPRITSVATLNTAVKPVAYIFKNPDIEKGRKLFAKNCVSCHGDKLTSDRVLKKKKYPKGIRSYLNKDGKYSELFHKIYYGSGKEMTRDAQGSLTKEQVRDVLAWLQSQVEAQK